jgi:hypothetical protein
LLRERLPLGGVAKPPIKVPINSSGDTSTAGVVRLVRRVRFLVVVVLRFFFRAITNSLLYLRFFRLLANFLKVFAR